MDSKLLNHFKTPLPSIEERIAAGKALREKCPRKSLGEYVPAADRTDPISILEGQGKTRLQELVPIRYARMLASPFAFLRGGAAIMAGDLAPSAVTGLTVQACGDMHVANFGVFASAERNLVFGINDFDETLPGPWEWDLKRLVASIVAAGKFVGADKNLCKEGVMAAVRSYQKHMRKFAKMGNMELTYSTIAEKDIQEIMSEKQREALKKITDKARARTHMQVLGKLTDIVDDQYRMRVDAPFIVRETHSESGMPIDEALGLCLESYLSSLPDDRRLLLQKYRIVDVVRKVVGVGSVGTRCWVLFLMGNNTEDPLFLQFKEAQPSVLEEFVSKSKCNNNGQRVVTGQRLIQGAPDIFLGWGELNGKQFYVRQLRDMKGGAEFDPEKASVENLPLYCELCAWEMAMAHAKSGDPAMISGYIGNGKELGKAMVRFAFAYNEQTEADYKVLEQAAKSGRVTVASGESTK